MKKTHPRTNSPTHQLTRSPTRTLSPVADYRARVETAYAEVGRRQGEFIKSVCAFGALLDEVAAFLGASNGGDRKSLAAADQGESTLQSWLAENCPEVNYNTAMGYRALAMKAARMLGGGTQAIAALQGRDSITAPGTDEYIDVDARVLAKRDQLFEQVDSRRKLEQMYLDFMGGGKPRGKPGRPKGTVAGQMERLTAVESAQRCWVNLVAEIAKHRSALYSAAALLPRADAENHIDELKGLVGAQKARLEEVRS